MNICETDSVNNFRTHEAALPMNQSHDALRGHIRKALDEAHGINSNSMWDERPYVHDVFPSHVVYSHKNETYKRKYTVTQGAAGQNPTVSVGDAKKVHVAYVNSSESAKVAVSGSDKPEEGVNITLPEGSEQVREAISFDETVEIRESKGVTTIPVKLIGPGWGSMAYYSEEVLKRDGPSVFKKGTHMMWNHATESEEADRPEGDLSNLAAVLIEDASWKDNGVKGPGLYSKAKVFSDYATQVAEKGPHIGISINAAVKAHEGEAEGRTGKIADKFVYAFSTDFVTKAGAKGAPIVPVLESDRGLQPERRENTMEQKDIDALILSNKTLTESNAKLAESNAKLEQGQNHILAVATVGAVLREAGITVGHKLLDRACQNPTMKEGKVDPEWVKSVVSDFSEGQGTSVKDLGGDVPDESKKHKESLKSAFEELGLSGSTLDIAVKGSV